MSTLSTLHRKEEATTLPLQPVIVEVPFQQWGLDFIGEFKDNSNNGYKWILMATNYFMKWVEAIPTKRATIRLSWNFWKKISSLISECQQISSSTMPKISVL
jgi:hypothetical protein